MMDREMRLRENQRRFRRANDALDEAGRRMGSPVERLPFLCECSNAGCLESVHLTPEEYRRLREMPNVFVTLAGHDDGTVDKVVGELGGYTLVEKEAAAAPQSAA
jgi:hypothetical protein